MRDCFQHKLPSGISIANPELFFIRAERWVDRKVKVMGFLGHVVKALLTLAGAFPGFAVVSLISMGYREMALLFLSTVMIPVSMIAYEYMTGWKK